MEENKPKIACKNCRFWVKTTYPSRGECRRHSPVYLILSTQERSDTRGIWPLTLDDNWCGDFEALKGEK